MAAIGRIPLGSWDAVRSARKAPLREAVTRDALIQALHWHAGRLQPSEGDEYSILDGLLKNERWRDCRESSDSAYALAILLLRIAMDLDVDPELDSNPEYQVAHADLAPEMYSLLNAWCLPTVPITERLRQGVVARALFGDAVWDLMLSGFKQGDWGIPEYIAVARPPFRAGMLAEPLDSVAQALPVLGLT